MLDSFNPAWIAAAAAVCTALIAWRASSNWRKGLENERIDNALSALHDLDARIDRVVALRGDKEHVWQAYHELWDSRSRFNQAYVVAQRYHRHLRLFNAPKNFVTCLHELRVIVEDQLERTPRQSLFFLGRTGASHPRGTNDSAEGWFRPPVNVCPCRTEEDFPAHS